MTTDSPMITIGLPVYNSERFLANSLDSLLAQTHRDFVLVISDNASTDGTAAICQAYAAKDSRIRYFRNEVNIGNPRNFNRVFSLARGSKYLKWSTSDDYWAPTFLERALEVMESDSTIALCYPGASIVDAAGQNPTPYDDVLHLMDDDPRRRFVKLLNGIKLAHQHLGLIRMSCLEQTHLLGTYPGSDIALLAELALQGKFYELPEKLFFRRFHDKSGSWKRKDSGHQATYYLAAGEKAKLNGWSQHLAVARAAFTSPLSLGDKFSLVPYLLRRLRWDARSLFAELVRYCRYRANARPQSL